MAKIEMIEWTGVNCYSGYDSFPPPDFICLTESAEEHGCLYFEEDEENHSCMKALPTLSYVGVNTDKYEVEVDGLMCGNLDSAWVTIKGKRHLAYMVKIDGEVIFENDYFIDKLKGYNCGKIEEKNEDTL